MKYIKSNPHPTGKKIGDCVVRAIAYGENKKWIEVYQELCELGAKLFDMPNSKPVYEEYLKAHGWLKHKMPKDETGKRIRLSDFIDKNINKTFIVNVARHVAYVENGNLTDTWDCSYKCIGNYFTR